MTREEAIKILRKEIECLSHSKCKDCILEKVCDPMITTPSDTEYIEAFAMAISALSENKGVWIPVSERLPEDYDRVLITVNGCRGLIVREARYCKAQNEFEVLHNHERWEVGEKGLLAWMPLPSPWKGE